VPVFPLPELVLFPGATVPLHVFELRYRTLVRDALSRDRTIALALLQPASRSTTTAVRRSIRWAASRVSMKWNGWWTTVTT
jgi:Lon protease-like protein